MEKALEKIVEAKENMNIGYIEWANDCIDEAIAELEALQSRSCDTCEYDGTFRYMGKDSKCTRCCNFFSSRYVRKGERDD